MVLKKSSAAGAVTAGMEFYSLDERPIADTWQGMEACVAAGLTRGIGVSNFSVKKLRALLDTSPTIPPAVNQVERHPFLQQSRLVKFCRENRDIHVTCYSPLGSMDRPAEFKAANEPRILDTDVIVQIAAAAPPMMTPATGTTRAVTPAQVILKWAMQQGTSTIPKSVNPGRMAENLAAATDMADLSQSDMDAIANLERNYRFVDGTFWTTPAGSPYTLANLWDDDDEQ